MRPTLAFLCVAACTLASTSASAAIYQDAELDKLQVDSAREVLLKKPQKGTFVAVEATGRGSLLVNPPAAPAKDKVLYEGTWSSTKGKGSVFTVTKLYRLAPGGEGSPAAQVEKVIIGGCGLSAGAIYLAAMSDASLQKAFGLFLQKESNLEPLELVLALRRLAEKPSVKDWNQIEADYISAKGAKEVNLSGSLRSKLHAVSALQKEYRNPENLLKSLKFKDAIAELNHAVASDMMDPAPRFRRQFLGADFGNCTVTPLDPKLQKGLK